MPAPRVVNFLLFLACTFLMMFAFFLEYVKDLEPCPLCMSQRIVVIAVGLIALLAAVHNPLKVGAKVYGALVASVSYTHLTLPTIYSV